MAAPNTASAPPASGKPERVRASRPSKKPESPGGSPEARRTAAAVLEVLTGVRTTVDAAKELAVSLPRYYQLEARAIAGLVRALEPRPRGPTRSPEREVAALRKEMARLERERDRAQALARATQRTLGLAPPARKEPKKDAGGKKRRGRRPVARSLKVVKVLRGPPATAQGSPAAPASASDVGAGS